MERRSNRCQKVAEQIQRALAPLLSRGLSREIGMVTVSGVKVSKDLAHARVFVTVLGGEPRRALEVLEREAGGFRHALAHTLPMRRMPKLQFAFDSSVSEGIRLTSLIDEVCASDQQSREEHGKKA